MAAGRWAGRVAKALAYSDFHPRCKHGLRVAGIARDAREEVMLLPITLTMAGAAALIDIWLGIRCAQARAASGVAIGDGGDLRLLTRMRAQANFVEYTPFFLILLGLIEYARGAQLWLWIVGLLFIAARIVHPFGLERGGRNALRGIGICISLLMLLILAGYAIWLSYGFA
jgi:uncharacterized membrane protein YecN with MAPEG domain